MTAVAAGGAGWAGDQSLDLAALAGGAGDHRLAADEQLEIAGALGAVVFVDGHEWMVLG